MERITCSNGNFANRNFGNCNFGKGNHGNISIVNVIEPLYMYIDTLWIIFLLNNDMITPAGYFFFYQERSLRWTFFPTNFYTYIKIIAFSGFKSNSYIFLISINVVFSLRWLCINFMASSSLVCFYNSRQKSRLVLWVLTRIKGWPMRALGRDGQCVMYRQHVRTHAVPVD